MASLTTFRVSELRDIMKTEHIPEPENGSGVRGNIIKPDLIQAIKTHRTQKVKKRPAPRRKKTSPKRKVTSPKRKVTSPKRKVTSPRRKKTSPRLQNISTVPSMNTVLTAHKQVWKNINNISKTELSSEELAYIIKIKTIDIKYAYYLKRKHTTDPYSSLEDALLPLKKLANKLYSVAFKFKLAFFIEFEKYFSIISKIPNDEFFIRFFNMDEDYAKPDDHYQILTSPLIKGNNIWKGNWLNISYDFDKIEGVTISSSYMIHKYNPVFFAIEQYIMEDDFKEGPFRTLLMKMDEINKKHW